MEGDAGDGGRRAAPLQVRDGMDGYLAEAAEDTAERLVELVRDPGLAIEMGRAGRERVRERFLVTRRSRTSCERCSSWPDARLRYLEAP